MKKQLLKTLLALMVGMVLPLGQAMAAEFTVTVKNLTNGIYFTPLLITAHDGNTHLFETGSPATPALQAMAEGGDIFELLKIVGGEDRDTKANPAGGLLSPGWTVLRYEVKAPDGQVLTWAMMASVVAPPVLIQGFF